MIKNTRSNLRPYRHVYAPLTRTGRRRNITLLTLEARCDYLLQKQGLYLEELAIFLWDDF